MKSVLGAEACERLAFLGVRSVLAIYMVGWLLYDARETRANYHAFLVATCLTPLLGGWIADRFLGRARAVLLGSLLTAAGLATLAAVPTRAGLLFGLGLVALGAGGLEPCAPTFLRDRLEAGHRPRLERCAAWTSWAVNLASAAAMLLVPWLLRSAGPAVAFAVPGVVMLLSAALHWAGRDASRTGPPSGARRDGFLRVTWRALRRLGTGRPGEHWLDAARDRHPAEAVEGAKAVFRIMGALAVVPVFWSLFDQTGSSWVLQAQAMRLSMGSWSLDPAQLQAANPLLVLCLAPLLGALASPAPDRRGRGGGPLRWMTAGLVATALSFAAAAVVQLLVDAGRPPHLLWQLPQYLLLTVGEVLVCVTGLELASTQAPRAMRSTVASIWLLAVAAGNLATWLVNALVGLEGTSSFLFFAGLMLAATLAFGVVARRARPVRVGA